MLRIASFSMLVSSAKHKESIDTVFARDLMRNTETGHFALLNRLLQPLRGSKSINSERHHGGLTSSRLTRRHFFHQAHRANQPCIFITSSGRHLLCQSAPRRHGTRCKLINSLYRKTQAINPSQGQGSQNCHDSKQTASRQPSHGFTNILVRIPLSYSSLPSTTRSFPPIDSVSSNCVTKTPPLKRNL